MQNKFTAISMCICCLSACGGGSNETGAAGGAAGFGPVPQYTTNAATFPSGTVLNAVTSFDYNNGSDFFDAVIVADDEATADKIANAFMRVNERHASVSSNSITPTLGDYSVQVQGTLTNGETFDSQYQGIRLSSREYVSINFLSFEGGTTGFATDGTSAYGVAPASAVYQGTSLFLGTISGVAVTEDGTFQMAVDFVNGSASLNASSATGSLTASGIRINNMQDAIYTPNAQISFDNRASVPATVFGFFAGRDAAGVHGIGYDNDDTIDAAAVVFMGKR